MVDAAMNRLVAGLIFILALFVYGCKQPVGSLSDSEGGGSKTTYDFLMLRPNRLLYDTDGGMDSRFDRKNDLRVFYADKDGFKNIGNDDPKLILEIVLNPGMMSESTSVIKNGYFPFSEPGRHVIKGTYEGKTDEYSIEVRGVLSNPGDGGDFFEIIWL